MFMSAKNRRLLKILSLNVVLIFSCSLAKADIWNQLRKERGVSSNAISWRQVSPGGSGMSMMLRYHPTIKDVVLLCPDMWNAYISDNDGTSWSGITDYDGDGSMNRFRDMSFSYSNPDFGLAVCSSELWLATLGCGFYKGVFPKTRTDYSLGD